MRNIEACFRIQKEEHWTHWEQIQAKTSAIKLDWSKRHMSSYQMLQEINDGNELS